MTYNAVKIAPKIGTKTRYQTSKFKRALIKKAKFTNEIYVSLSFELFMRGASCLIAAKICGIVSCLTLSLAYVSYIKFTVFIPQDFIKLAN